MKIFPLKNNPIYGIVDGSRNWIKWKERQERRLTLEVPTIESVHSWQHARTGSDVIRDNLILHCLMLDLRIGNN